LSFTNPIVEAGLSGLVALFESRAVTPLEAAEAYLSRIARLDPMVGAFTDVDAAGARDAASAAGERRAAGVPLSPIDGVPLAVKANVALSGRPWTNGIGAYRERVAEVDAACVAALKAAGAVILGSVNMEEGALGTLTDNPWYGRTHNPWRHGHTPGGSSGGSGAAVAAGLCAAALGTDTLGSVRIPSGYCGVFGHKPTGGLISADGVDPLSWTFDTVGVHARSAEDCAQLFAAAAGGELATELAELAPAAQLAEAPLAALDPETIEDLQPAVARGYAQALAQARRAGLSIETIRLDLDLTVVRRLALAVVTAEGRAAHEDALAADPAGFSEPFRTLLAWGADKPAWTLARAYRSLGAVQEELQEALSPYAALITPVAPHVAFAHGAGSPVGQANLTAIANLAGLPATAFPVGSDEHGLPLACQAVAWDDATALGLAAVLSKPLGAPPNFRG
jgi:aspartyl-tRNA(Asn)/glutamyl-tRNA(Gln) amidotransferase subunit A